MWVTWGGQEGNYVKIKIGKFKHTNTNNKLQKESWA